MSTSDPTSNAELKRCSKCGDLKLRVQFGCDRKRKDGLCPTCKQCRADENSKRPLVFGPKLPKCNPDRFWFNVSKGTDTECWIWTAGKNKNGYGKTTLHGKDIGAHRLSWIIAFGEIPDNLHVLHKCDNPSCVNPGHLFLGTNADNSRDRAQKGRNPFQNGEANPYCKLSCSDVLEIRRLSKLGVPQGEIARRYNIKQTNVSCIILRKTWRHI
jgi:hypothetical protein